MIDRQMRAHGSRVAIAHAATELTYAELRERVEAREAALGALGLRPGDLVAVVADRGPRFVETILAIWRLGAAYLPLNPEDPAAWRAGVVRAAGAVLVAGQGASAAVPGIPFTDLDDSDPAPSPSNPTATRAVHGPDDLAYVICTSGSTGKPKLVMIEQRGVTNLVHAQRAYFGGDLGPDARVLQFFHPAYDAALFDILLALANGARLEITDSRHTSGGEPLADLLRERQVTIAVLPAPVLRTLEPGRFPDLAAVASIGDVCLPETARRWSARHRFINGYGPSEATVCTTMHDAPADGWPDTAGPAVVPIGRPIAGYRVHLLDDALREVPDGDVGEICIAGDGVGRGYLGQPGLTERCFVPDPFGSRSGARMYRSGDLGRRLPGGDIEFVGRIDDQVKVRGARIELGQVEKALAAQSGVRDAVAVVDGGEEQRLLGYVVAAPGATVAGPALRAALAAELPGHLVPDQIVVLAALPLLTSGKVDRSRLPRPIGPVLGKRSAPRDRTEESVARMAAELLGLDRIGIHDDLFAAGAHSLLAAQLAARVRAALGVEVPLSKVLDGGTVARIAALAKARGGTATHGPRPGAAPDGPAPSFAQQRVWLMHQFAPSAHAYHSQAAIRLAGPLDGAALNAALTDLVRRHEVLRSRFPSPHGQLRCEVVEPWQVSVEVLDLSKQDPARHAELLGAAVRDVLAEPFDLANDPPFHWLLIRLSSTEHVFVMAEHHIVHDGWSFNVFVRELLQGYADHVAGTQVERPLPLVGYYDLARWQREWLDSAEAAAQRAFWRRALAGAETVLRLPHGGAGTSRSFRGPAPRVEIPGDLARRLNALAERNGTSLFTVLLAVYFLLLGGYSGSQDVLVGSAVADRRWQESEGLLGMFVNTLVFRGRMHGDPTFEAFLGRVRRMVHQAYDNQELPFELILEESGATRHRADANPLIQAQFACHDSVLGTVTGNPLDVTLIEGLSNGSAKFAVSVIAVPRYRAPGRISRLPGGVLHVPASAEQVGPAPRTVLDGITLAWEFDAGLVEPVLIDGMPASYRHLLEAVADRPDTPLSALQLLDLSALADVLAIGRGPELQAVEGWLPAMVARWAAETPEAPAVLSRQRPLTYRKLKEAADTLARALVAAGVRPGDTVAVGAPHSAESVIAQLAVLTARAVLLTLDTAHPSPRLAALVRHARARALVTTAELADRVPVPAGLPVLFVGPADAPAGAAGLGVPAAPLPDGRPNDLAYVLYTSGSTGEPKGVQVEHRSVAARLHRAEVTGLRPGARMLAVASPSFDMSVLEVWGALLNGAAVRFLPPGWSVPALADCLTDGTVTHAILPTAVFHELVRQRPEALAGPERVLVGGDVISTEAFRAARRIPGTTVINVYGPTETTVIATAQSAAGWADPTASHVPIGSALPGTHVVIVDEALRPLPLGVVGEICIGGAGVARGHLGDPGLTAERFVPDPFAPPPGGRLYRSGDLGRLLPGGVVEFFGRCDEQLKIRGFRVEPGEVQAALRTLPDVADALVLGDREASGDRRLIGYAVAVPGRSPSGTRLRQALADRLPAHLVPSIVEVLDSWPLTPAGKIDRARLAKPVLARTAAVARPRNDTERVLARLAAKTLGVEEVGVRDDLLELGMHSLQAMSLATEASAELGREITLGTVFAQRTIAALAAAVPQLPTPAPPISRLPRHAAGDR
ncbi:amino acid adenylation domain-containing protein [Kitasatospora sp. NPDC056531]|uniref:amino acid adenylation domain-containing protein n=1 Tax=Kitasatospora sp. NPDC056531 TaxID=3345856 RepID=UPI0036920F55